MGSITAAVVVLGADAVAGGGATVVVLAGTAGEAVLGGAGAGAELVKFPTKDEGDAAPPAAAEVEFRIQDRAVDVTAAADQPWPDEVPAAVPLVPRAPNAEAAGVERADDEVAATRRQSAEQPPPGGSHSSPGSSRPSPQAATERFCGWRAREEARRGLKLGISKAVDESSGFISIVTPFINKPHSHSIHYK